MKKLIISLGSPIKSDDNIGNLIVKRLQKENKELKEKIHILELIKSDWIDSQLTDKKFPEDYIQGKKFLDFEKILGI